MVNLVKFFFSHIAYVSGISGLCKLCRLNSILKAFVGDKALCSPHPGVALLKISDVLIIFNTFYVLTRLSTFTHSVLGLCDPY